MNKTLSYYKALCFAIVFLLIATPLSVKAGVAILNMITVSYDNSLDETLPAVAYNSQRQEYLVVWYNDRAGNDDIIAQRVSVNGTLIGGKFYISAGVGADRRYPKVAYNSKQDQYLVVWEHYDTSSGYYDIKCRRVDGSGYVLDASDILIESGSNLHTPSKLAVSYASTPDRYLVVWEDVWHPIPIQYTIYGQVITPQGALEGSDFTISAGTDQRQEPDLAYNRHANRYLVVWQQKAGTLWAVHGQQVKGDGGTYQGDILIAYYSGDCEYPSVASIPNTQTNEKFLVVWQLEYSTSPSIHNIYGIVINEDGSLASSDVKILLSYTDTTVPSVAGDETSQQYLVAWQNPLAAGDNPIYARALSYDGALKGEVANLEGQDANYPAVASGPNGDFFTVWQDKPTGATTTGIFGHLWGNRLFMPLTIK